MRRVAGPLANYGERMYDALAVTAAVLALAALLVSLATHRRLAGRRRDSADLPTDLRGLRAEVAALRTEAGDGLRHLAVVRYDAFGDVGGHLSWTLALLDEGGDGVVLSSINGRSEARTYAKSVSGWTSDQQLSAEEEEAIAHARS